MASERHISYKSLEVLDGTSEVDTAHCLHQQSQLLSPLGSGKRERALVLHAVYLAYVFAVNEYLHEIMPVEVKHAAAFCLRQ